MEWTRIETGYEGEDGFAIVDNGKRKHGRWSVTVDGSEFAKVDTLAEAKDAAEKAAERVNEKQADMTLGDLNERGLDGLAGFTVGRGKTVWETTKLGKKGTLIKVTHSDGAVSAWWPPSAKIGTLVEAS